MKLEMNKLRKLDTNSWCDWNKFVTEMKLNGNMNAEMNMNAGMKMNIGIKMNIRRGKGDD